jgi:hypothetical protein
MVAIVQCFGVQKTRDRSQLRARRKAPSAKAVPGGPVRTAGLFDLEPQWMDELPDQIARSADKAVAMCEGRGGGKLDYSETSLAVVEDVLAEAGQWLSELSPEQVTALVQNFGCYVLEVGRREFGGRYQWHDGRDQPVLVVGEPTFRIAMLSWDKVRGRLGGDKGDNIPFFFAGFAERARQATPGTDVLYV